MGSGDAHTEIGAVILAAGLGERMKSARRPKALVELGGLTLLERAYRTLRLGGVGGTIVVVVGHRGDEITRFVRQRPMDVQVVENPDYARGNGTSVLAGLPHLPERFVVAMADHVHVPNSIRAVLDCNGDFVAVVDAKPMYADPCEATRVRVDGGLAVQFSKGLEPYDALDTGLFICSRSALMQLSTDTQAQLSWNQFKRLWLESGRPISTCDLSGVPWIDVDSSAELHDALDMLIKWASSGTDGFVSRNVNRKVSRWITRLLLQTGISANQTSLLSFLVATAGALAVGRGAWRRGAILIQVSSILDGCDGELARARLESSPQGGVFDATLDRWADALITSGMAVGSRAPSASWAAYPALAGVLLVPYTRAKLEAEFGEIPPGLGRFGATRDVRLALFTLGALVQKPLFTLALVATLSNLEVARRLIALRQTSA